MSEQPAQAGSPLCHPQSGNAIWLLFWLAAASGFLFANWATISGFTFRDPDDALRLVEVRNWLAGQGWFDVSQPRISPPTGGDIHWSRFVDMPIAAAIILLRLFLPPLLADQAASVIVPLLLMGGYFAVMQSILIKLDGRRTAWLFTGHLVAATSLFAIHQFAPLRLDHHGWQLLLSLGLFRVALERPSLRNGLLAGALLSLHLAISLEGLPYLALFGLFAGIGYLRHAEGWPRLEGLVLALAIASFALSIAGRGWTSLSAMHCDAISRPHLGAFAACAALLIMGSRIIGHATLPRRLIVSALAAAGGGGVLLWTSSDCLLDPFSALDPLVYEVWYLNISEGLPVWAQSHEMVAAIVLQPMLGLAGALLALRTAIREHDRDRSYAWAVALFLGFGAFLLSLLMLRGMYATHAFTATGAAFLLLSAWNKARTIKGTLPRISASVAVSLLLPLIATSLAGALIGKLVENQAEADAGGTKSAPSPAAGNDARLAACRKPASLAALDRFAPATILAPLDIGPSILVASHHSVVATSHHRNDKAIRAAIVSFSTPASDAEHTVRATGADYVAICQGINEQALYATRNPHSLIGQLEAGTFPAWLAPVPLRDSHGMKLYRVLPPRG